MDVSKKPFIVGERVSVSGYVNGYQAIYSLWTNKHLGTVAKIMGLHIVLKLDNVQDEKIAHPAQIRRLKPKAKPLEVWARRTETGEGLSNITQILSLLKPGEEILFREVREKR